MKNFLKLIAVLSLISFNSLANSSRGIIIPNTPVPDCTPDTPPQTGCNCVEGSGGGCD